MSRGKSEEKRLDDLVGAFTELGPTWVRWVNACLPSDAVSYVRMRLLVALECAGEQSMGQLASELGVTPRRVTALVEALEVDSFVERHSHPTDGRSTLVAITDTGRKAQQVGWEEHRAEVAQAFGDLPVTQQKQLLDISRALTDAMRARLAGRGSVQLMDCGLEP
jgi:DNA-binding MarR family transcriptional regulator